MDKSHSWRGDDSGNLFYRRIYLLISKDDWGWQAIGAACGLAGAMLSIILGLLLWIVVRFLATGYFGSFLNAIEVLFFLLTMPLLIFGAYCLDLLEKKPPHLALSPDSRFEGFKPSNRLRRESPPNN